MLTEGEAELNGLLGDVDLSGKEEEEVSKFYIMF